MSSTIITITLLSSLTIFIISVMFIKRAFQRHAPRGRSAGYYSPEQLELIDKAAKALAAWPDAVRTSDDTIVYFECPRISLIVTAIRMAGIQNAEAENRILQIVNEKTATQTTTTEKVFI